MKKGRAVVLCPLVPPISVGWLEMISSRAVVLCTLVALLGNLAFVGNTQAGTRTVAQYASDFARDLYENKDIGTTHDLSQYVGSAEFTTYLSEKVTIRQLVTYPGNPKRVIALSGNQ